MSQSTNDLESINKHRIFFTIKQLREPQLQTHGAQTIDLVATIRESLVQMTPWLLSKGLELVFEPMNEAALVNVDAGIIHIALNNLVTNAANFSLPHGLITLRLVKNRHHCELCVEDDEPGIDETERDRLFERFNSRGNDQ